MVSDSKNKNQSKPSELPEAKTAGELEKGDVGVAKKEPAKLVVDERMIPDANLPTDSVKGVLDIAQEGSGLLRPQYQSSDNDVYISASQIRRFNLRVGDLVGGQARRPKDNERYWGLLKVELINGNEVGTQKDRVDLDDLTAIYPDKQITLSTDKETLTTRVTDLVAPLDLGKEG